MSDLRAFLATYADKPFAWGVDDCCLFLADWFEASHGWDPAAELRRTYADEAACRRLVFWSGGIVRLVSSIAVSAGLERVRDELRDGDIGLIKVGRLKIGAIRVGRYWAVRNERIGFVSRAKVIRAWRI